MLKAFKCDDSDVFAAESSEQATQLWKDMVGEDEQMEDDYPRELSDEELDVRHPAFDEDERPIEGQTISIREMLAEHGEEPGWLCGSGW